MANDKNTGNGEAVKRNEDILKGDVSGHTRYLQGIDMPILVNSVIEDGGLQPCGVSEMHIAEIRGTRCVVITPNVVG